MLRRKANNQTARRLRLGAVLGLWAVMLVTGGVYFQEIHTWGRTVIARSTGATVEKIIVEGAVYTDREDLAAALGVQRGDPLFDIPTAKARTRLEALPWIRLAAVERQLPDTLKINVYEQVPLARLREEDSVWVMNKAGDKIVPVADDAFAGLPMVSGEMAADKAAALFMWLMEKPQMMTQLQDAAYVGKRRWDLRFKSGVTVQLPAENPHGALALLEELDRRRHVLALPAGEVDLRLADRVTLRLPAGVEHHPTMEQG